MEKEQYEIGGSGTEEKSSVHSHTQSAGKHHKSHRSTIVVGVALFLMALLIGAVGVGVYLYSKYPSEEQKKSAVEEVEAPVPEPALPTINLSHEPYSGMYGASVIEMTMDFNTGEGVRFYRADPNNVYTLRITDVKPLDEGRYEVEFTEFLESRIKVGVFKGVLSDSEFRGQYTSTHGDVREFVLTR